MVRYPTKEARMTVRRLVVGCTGRWWRLVGCIAAIAALPGCEAPTSPSGPLPPQTLVLLPTPKFISDFSSPEEDIARFFEHYSPLTSHMAETIVVFAVGNSDHILEYRGKDHWDDLVEWARYTDGGLIPISDQTLDYHQVQGIVRAFRSEAAKRGITLKVFDQIEQGLEFTHNRFKVHRHPECMVSINGSYSSFDIRGRLTADGFEYASAPAGIEAGTQCGEFLVDQMEHYVEDLGFDGILYGNQLGTRGQWRPDWGPGYSADEAAAVRAFMEHSRRALGDKELIWFDSYNTVEVERSSFSFPADAYQFFDYIIASGFCVIVDPPQYLATLKSKLRLGGRARILATLDYVDPWYVYNSMTLFPHESRRLEEIAITYRQQIDGFVFFANDEVGTLVPRELIESFARRYFDTP
jgi:hypothetical protein